MVVGCPSCWCEQNKWTFARSTIHPALDKAFVRRPLGSIPTATTSALRHTRTTWGLHSLGLQAWGKTLQRVAVLPEAIEGGELLSAFVAGLTLQL